jgi:hypothetical protein
VENKDEPQRPKRDNRRGRRGRGETFESSLDPPRPLRFSAFSVPFVVLPTTLRPTGSGLQPAKGFPVSSGLRLPCRCALAMGHPLPRVFIHTGHSTTTKAQRTQRGWRREAVGCRWDSDFAVRSSCLTDSERTHVGCASRTGLGAQGAPFIDLPFDALECKAGLASLQLDLPHVHRVG